jgi:uncharacterized short protein YbdD (DUF466 family)
VSEASEPAPQRAAAIDAAEARRQRRARLLDRARALRQAYLQVFGIPDYEGYLAHMAARHPGKPVPTRREFFAQAIDRKYSMRGPRCC